MLRKKENKKNKEEKKRRRRRKFYVDNLQLAEVTESFVSHSLVQNLVCGIECKRIA